MAIKFLRDTKANEGGMAAHPGPFKKGDRPVLVAFQQRRWVRMGAAEYCDAAQPSKPKAKKE